VTSPRKRHTNRLNARASTGPRTAAGKARSAQNAHRHGLSLPALCDPARVAQIGALARALAGNEADVLRLALARRVTAAQIDVLRVRHARRKLIAMLNSNPGVLARIASLDRYERYALTKRRMATREFGTPQPQVKTDAFSQSFSAFCQNEANE
jgi:hypothetical protein